MSFAHLFLVLALAAKPAPAPSSELERRSIDANREGGELARAGQYEAAIERFKLAESLVPRFEHHCNIGKAYRLLKRWAQAWLFLDDCRARAGNNVKPPWVADLIQQTEASLKAEGFVSVTVTSETLVSVSFTSLSASEWWRVAGERRFWHPAAAKASMVCEDGPVKWTQELIFSGPELRVNALAPVPAMVPAPIVPPAVVEAPVATAPVAAPPTRVNRAAEPRSRPVAGPLILAGGGVVVGALGMGSWFAAKGSKAEAEQLEAGPGFDAVVRRFEVERAVAYGAFGLGGALALAGLGWWLFGETTPVTVAVSPGGAGVVFSGTF